MATQIVVPELGDSVIDATVIKWLKREGDPVNTGETVVELETEKANFEVPAITSGVVLKIGKNEGDEVKVGDALGVIDESASATPPSAETETPQSEPGPVSDAGKASATPVARNIARNKNIDLSTVEPKTEGGRITKADVEQATARSAAAEKKRLREREATYFPLCRPCTAEKQG
ncbi:biotin/lipoyl-containing protein [Candidatus Mycalebacterium sp.]